MAYDEGLYQRVLEYLEETPGAVEKKMFGGMCFLIHGNMACGIINDYLIVRVGLEGYEASLKLPHTLKFDFTGKPMKGWIMVSSDGYASDEELFEWVDRSVRYASSLPSK
jgi:TfoX/Sxy family transcriptional regulator of competence genes